MAMEDRRLATDEHSGRPDGHVTAEAEPAAQSAASEQGLAQAHESRLVRRPRVVIVGAGFAGLNAARDLGDTEVDVVLVDRNNYHGFWPLLYQVATAGLEPEAIAYPVRAILRRHENISFRLAEVRGVDLEHRLVLTERAPLSYDYLILAAGSANNYFGNDALAEHTFGMKDINEAERLRNQVLCCFEQAEAEEDAERRAALLTFVIVGGGPTGVELAGALVELFRHVLRKDHPNLNLREARVVLVEASDKILAAFHPSLQRAARKRLVRMGVELLLSHAVESVRGDTVSFKDGSELRAATVVWAAGVKGAKLAEAINTDLARGARVPVQPTLNLAEHPEVFVVGDMAYLEGFQGEKPYPMVAPVAIQQGQLAARNVLALTNQRAPERFRYRDRGSMATIGRRAAVLEAGSVRLSGPLAWVGWLFVHLIQLVGFRNRLVVLANWAYNYFTWDRGVRLITRA